MVTQNYRYTRRILTLKQAVAELGAVNYAVARYASDLRLVSSALRSASDRNPTTYLFSMTKSGVAIVLVAASASAAPGSAPASRSMKLVPRPLPGVAPAPRCTPIA